MFIVIKDGRKIFQGTQEECSQYAEENGGKVQRV